MTDNAFVNKSVSSRKKQMFHSSLIEQMLKVVVSAELSSIE
jgi:hypothetical protein